MTRILFSILLMLSIGISQGQTTFFWVGGTGTAAAPTTFHQLSNWNTALDGSGTTRSVESATDVLVVDGSNIGGTPTPTTGQLFSSTSSTHACGQLKLVNGANLIIGRTATGNCTFTVNGDATAADDLFVDASSTLTIGGPFGNYDVYLVMVTPATGLINGTVYLSPLSTTIHTRSYITSPAAGSLVFGTGASCHITDSTTTSGFNGSVAGSVVFKTGASLYYYSGRSPIGNNSTTQISNFESGSNCYFRGSNVMYTDGVTAYGSSSWSGNKMYANLYIENGANIKSDGTFYKIEGLNIAAGSSLTMHTSGSTPLLGNLVVNGSLTYPVTGSTNTLVMGGNTPQSITGSGIIKVPSLTVANHSDVTLSRSLTVDTSTNIYGKINFGTANQISGGGTFSSKVAATLPSVTGNTVSGSYQITGVPVATLAGNVGYKITGSGIAPNTNVIYVSAGNGFITLSKPAIATATGVTLNFLSDTATLVTANANGLDSLSGSVIVAGTKVFQSGTNYIINGATSKPFGISSGLSSASINAGFVEINAAVTVNSWMNIYNHLTVNGKITLRPLDTIHINSGAYINGNYNSSNYIATAYNSTSGAQSIVQYDGLSTAVILPIGTPNNYLPVTLTPSGPSSFTAAVFEGITANGAITGTALTAIQKQRVVNAVWNINRLSGTGSGTLKLGWQTALEGSTFTTLPNAEIGLMNNTGTTWALPIGTGDNTANTVTGTVSSFGSFSAGAVPSAQAFIFNAIPSKTYGNADFNGGASSLNITEPIIYTSSNPAVATIVSGNIHIVSAGTAVITASQAGDGFYPAASVARTLTVNQALLTITAVNKIKFEGDVNPVFTAIYTGFVLGETQTVLLTPAVFSTTAVLTSLPGNYPINVSGATATNYSISFVNAILTVQAKQAQTITFNALATKNYGNADFAAGALSTNATIPITYASSDANVATIVAGNIHIVGAGTVTITASQAGNTGYWPAADVARVLIVNKALLYVKVRDTSKFEFEVNPPFSVNYTGFVLGETVANLSYAPLFNTLATTGSSAGYYSIDPYGAVSGNYMFTFVSGKLTIYPSTGKEQQSLNVYMSNLNTLTVRAYTATAALGDIIVYDMSGRKVARKNIFMPVGFINSNLAVNKLPNGIYIVSIQGKGVDVKKMISIMR